MRVLWWLIADVVQAEFLLLMLRVLAWAANADPLDDGDTLSADMALTLRRRHSRGRTVWTAITAFYSIHIAKDSPAGYCAYVWHREKDELLVVLQSYATPEKASGAVSEWIQKRKAAPGGASNNSGNVPPQTDAEPWTYRD